MSSQYGPGPGYGPGQGPSSGGSNYSQDGGWQRSNGARPVSTQMLAGNSMGAAGGMRSFPSSGGTAMSPNGSSSDAASIQSSSAPHRRTQSLRPFSAFQPLENPSSFNGEPDAGGGRPASPTGSMARSIRSTPAPVTFKSGDLRKALALHEAQHKKIYMEGYLSRREELNVDGKPLHPGDAKKQWQLCFVQLCGTVLSTWNVRAMEEAAKRGQEVPPSYTNITDSFVDYVGHLTEDKQAVVNSKGHYENVFALNSAGNNRTFFCVEGPVGKRLVQAWVNAIRLASWEKVRLEEIYTGALLRARMGAVGALQRRGSLNRSAGSGGPDEGEADEASISGMAIKSPLSKGKLEGWVKARFMGSTEWKRSWLVLCDKPEEAETKSKFWKLGGAGSRSSVMSLTGTPQLGSPDSSGPTLDQVEPPPGSNGARGIGLFYENKKSKTPFAALLFVGHAFAVYPSRPELVEGSSLFKVEGALPMSQVLSGTNRVRQTGWVMLMPDLEGGSNKGANAEMMKWVIGFMDAFRLYGRPDTLDWEPRNPTSTFFAYPIGPYKDRLFLDRELAEFLDVREERHLAHRANLHGIMAMRMQGERTPILPPLPQPNKDSTASLNPGGAARAPAPAQSPPQQAPHAELPALTADLSSKMDLRGSGSGPGLDPIGERSREASTVLPSPNSREPSYASAQQQIAPLAIAKDVAPAPVPLAAQAPVPTPALAPAPAPAAVPVATQAAAQAAALAAVFPASPPPVAAQAVAPQAAGQPINMAPPASANLAANHPALAKRASDVGLGSYDEGALFFMRNMSDQVPAHQQAQNRALDRDSIASSTATSSVTPIVPAAAPAPVRHSNMLTANGNTANGYTANGSTANGITANGDAGAAASAAAAAAAAAATAGHSHGTSASEQRASMRPDASIGEDALAAYSFLEKPPSPIVASREIQPAVEPEAPAVAPPPAAFPSSFNANKRATERKNAAQLQAQAHQEALSKPGRPKGHKKSKSKGAHAWGEQSSEEDDDEEDEEDDEEELQSQSAAAASAAAASAAAAAVSRPRSRNPSDQGSAYAGRQSPALGTPRTQPASLAQSWQGTPMGSQSGSPAGTQVGGPGRPSFQNRASMFNTHLGAQHAETPIAGAEQAGRQTFVQLNPSEQPGSMTAVFQPHGLLQAGAQEKAERSAKVQEAEARQQGSHLVSVPNKPPPPQAGLLGAITAHERERKSAGGFGATLTERERERVMAERKQKEEEAFRQQQMAMGQAPGGMPFMNPYMMWQQAAMMQGMMQPPPWGMQPGFGGFPGYAGSQAPGSVIGGAPGNDANAMAQAQQAQHAQMQAMQAAQMAYQQAMSQIGGEGGSVIGSPSPMGGMPMGMPPMGAPFNPYMGMMGGYPGYMGAGSEMGMPPPQRPAEREPSRERAARDSPR